jgi:hypothetical protein
MKRSRLSGIAGSLAGVVLTTLLGCGGLEDVDDGTDQTESAALWRRSRRPPAVKPTPPPPSTTPDAGAGGGSSGGLTTEQVIAAAQTPDGRAIPQPSGPNGACPEVVVRLGFWSCPTVGDTCASGGRSCTCHRTDGEGQLPSWVCD